MLFVTDLLQIHPRFDISCLVPLRAVGSAVDILEGLTIVVLRIKHDIVLSLAFKHIFKPPK